MKLKELKELTLKKLQEQLVDFKKEQFNLRFQQTSNNLANPARIRVVRRTIARLLTLINQKSIAE
jgi:large subunit ribosomal protein L29